MKDKLSKYFDRKCHEHYRKHGTYKGLSRFNEIGFSYFYAGHSLIDCIKGGWVIK